METRVKERLTGALILVAAMVIIVPEIFSGRRADQSEGDVPAAGSASDGPPLRTYTAELMPGTGASEGDVPGASRPVEPPREAEPPVASAPTPAPSAAPSQSSPQPASQSPPSPAPSPASRATEPAPPPPRPSTPAAEPAPRGGWFVQVGSFSQSANAQRVATTLRGAGHAVVVLPPAGPKKLVRVRVGPVGDRAAAVDLQRRLAAAGHDGAVVAP